MLNIRRRSARQVQVTRWQQRYQPNKSVSTPCAGERYFHLELIGVTETISALVPVDRWCQFCWPELNSCAWEALNNSSLAGMFMQKNGDKRFFSEVFRIGNLKLVDGKEVSQSWLTIAEPLLGTVLLDSPFEHLATVPAVQKVQQGVTQQADWVLGYSYISARLLQTLALRDVLCIQQLQLYLSIAGRPVARFQKQQEGVFVLEDYIDNVSETEDAALMLNEMPESSLPDRFDVNKLTVKLTFVLGQSDIPFEELVCLQPGTVYQLGADKDREVKVYANKQLVAEGELIYIGDGEELGLEVTKLAFKGRLGS